MQLEICGGLMKQIAVALAVVAASFATSAFADVGVSLNIGQPGFYGRLDLGDAPQPRLVSRRPIIIERVPADAIREPIYLRVPRGHQRHWRQNCSRYNACGQPVYFVDDRWYNDVYVPHYRRHHEHEERRDEHREERRDEYRHDHEGDHDHDHGHDHDRR
jgi:hypothetical protein